MKSNGNKIMIKKSYEEYLEDDLCNFNSMASDKSEKNEKSKHNHNKKSRGHSKSRISTKNDSFNLSTNNANNSQNENANIVPNMNSLLEMIDQLKEKINIYENEIKGLIDEKLQMQLTINNLQIVSYKKSKGGSPNKSQRNLDINTSEKSNSLGKSNESAIELNKLFFQEASGMRKELKVLNENVERQKNLLDKNNSFLDETTLDQINLDSINDVNVSQLNDNSLFNNNCRNCQRHRKEFENVNL